VRWGRENWNLRWSIIFNYSALISACEKCGEWEKVMEVVVLDTVVFGAVIDAFEKGGA
jgi:pentatricopeptide repeat protein